LACGLHKRTWPYSQVRLCRPQAKRNCRMSMQWPEKIQKEENFFRVLRTGLTTDLVFLDLSDYLKIKESVRIENPPVPTYTSPDFAVKLLSDINDFPVLNTMSFSLK